jgi:hypothetical protein
MGYFAQKATLADGSTKSKTTDDSGLVELDDAPPGPATVKLTELGAPKEEPVEAPEGARQAIATLVPSPVLFRQQCQSGTDEPPSSGGILQHRVAPCIPEWRWTFSASALILYTYLR